MQRFIPVSEPLLNGNEKKYLSECIDTGWISSEGPFVSRFEQEFARKVGRRYGIAVSNGSNALEIAVRVMDIKKDDEVIMPSFTIISCAQPVATAGAKVVPVDCDLYDFNMLTGEIEKNITERTRAIMPVHIYGLPVNMNEVLQLAEKYDLRVIEDAAEMHGQTYYGRPCGSFGDISVFSFYANKIIASGEGGMLVCDDELTAERCRYYRNLCFKKERRFVHEEIGYNFRMTNMQAALGLAQLERIDEIIALKKKVAVKFNELLSSNSLLQLPVARDQSAENIYWVYPLVLKKEFGKDAAFVMNELGKMNIGTRPFFYPMHLQPVLNRMGAVSAGLQLPNSELIAERGFYIPSSPTLKDDEIEYIAESVNKIVK